MKLGNWLYAAFSDLRWVSINTPDDLSDSPVMAYLEQILNEAMENGGSFKATSKGNLPTKLVNQASELLPNFTVSKCPASFIKDEFNGRNEDNFNAIHYTRILAECAGIIYRRSGRYHLKKECQKRYQADGLKAFFLPQ